MSQQLTPANEVPVGNFAGFFKYLRNDLTSGFLVFLIALPLCLGISLACGFPPLAGIFTAVTGAVLTSLISNSELTIKGPAAGLIVIAIGCIEDFGGNGMLDGVMSPEDLMAYKAALAVGVAAAALQILFGLLRAGILGEFFPSSVVHGMLAAIGVIIISKQIPVALGVSAKGEPLELLREIPHFIMEANPAIACIGIISAVIMFLWPFAGSRIRLLKSIPAPLVVLAAAIPLGIAFDLLHPHSYLLHGHQYQLSEQYLVKMPGEMFGIFREVTHPDFSALTQPKAWKWVFMFFMIGSIESLLSAKAIDMIDPWKRKTNMNRDVLAVGVANLCASMIGGLPMISEIVRSKANIDNGARTRFADLWHGVFLLTCVALIPTLLHRIPQAALAAMLVYTGTRLAHPKEFAHMYHIGREQLIIFMATLVGVLATDLLVGIAIGIAVKVTIHILNGVSFNSLFKPYLVVQDVDDNTSRIMAHESAVFSNWIPFRRQIEQIGLVQHRNVIVDLSNATLVDHSVMDKLHEMQLDFEQAGLSLELQGLDTLRQLSRHQHSTRKRGLTNLKRLTLICEEVLEDRLAETFLRLGATGYTAIPCTGMGRRQMQTGAGKRHDLVRIEVIGTSQICSEILEYLRREIMGEHRLTACLEAVDVLRPDDFVGTVDQEFSLSHS